MRHLLAAVLVCVLATHATAQTSVRARWTGSVDAGFAAIRGKLTPPNPFGYGYRLYSLSGRIVCTSAGTRCFFHRAHIYGDFGIGGGFGGFYNGRINCLFDAFQPDPELTIANVNGTYRCADGRSGVMFFRRRR